MSARLSGDLANWTNYCFASGTSDLVVIPTTSPITVITDCGNTLTRLGNYSLGTSLAHYVTRRATNATKRLGETGAYQQQLHNSR